MFSIQAFFQPCSKTSSLYFVSSQDTPRLWNLWLFQCGQCLLWYHPYHPILVLMYCISRVMYFPSTSWQPCELEQELLIVLLLKRLQNAPRFWYTFLLDISLDRREKLYIEWLWRIDLLLLGEQVIFLPVREFTFLNVLLSSYLEHTTCVTWPQTSGKGTLYKENKVFHRSLMTSTRP